MKYPAVFQKQTPKKLGKKQLRAKELLFGLIRLYIQTAKPIGSQTLKENGFDHLSSATIRNYFTFLEQEGYLVQMHTSGGRAPTPEAYRYYFESLKDEPISSDRMNSLELHFGKPKIQDPKNPEALSLFNELTDRLSSYLNTPAFIIAPIFEQDSIKQIKLWKLSHSHCLCVIQTQLGFIHTETLPILHLKEEYLERIEAFIQKRIEDPAGPLPKLPPQEEHLAIDLYNELIMRHLSRHSTTRPAPFIKSGLSELIQYPELNNPHRLAPLLYFFEHAKAQAKVQEVSLSEIHPQIWIGPEMREVFINGEESCLITAPYMLNQRPVGTLGILGPIRIDYKKAYDAVCYCSSILTHLLTSELYNFKIALSPEEGEVNPSSQEGTEA